uniref:Uncharacterized protein n=1 Tax=Caenorhabditis japonica TaxID=281687 RepID=A0A8R1EQE9_CAEJA
MSSQQHNDNGIWTKERKVAAVHASTISRDAGQQQRSGYSRYAQEALLMSVV